MEKIGFDIGTWNLICAKRGENPEEIKYKRVVNAFIEIPLADRFTFNMMKAAKVDLFEQNSIGYALGEKAVSIAYSLKNLELKRPMSNGCLNPREKEAFSILMRMIHSLVGKIEDNAIVYYSVPANAINKDTDADYHQKVLEQMFKKYNVDGKTIQAFPINEALAVVFAELAEKAFTGIGVSFGAGQINFCYSVFSQPISTFSIVGSGDWIDEQSAKATGENPVVINKEKTKIDLTKQPQGLIERAIHAQYRIMAEKTFMHIKKAIADSDKGIKVDEPVDVVLAGGTASPNGFELMVKEIIDEIKLPIPIGKVYKPKDNLQTVARGTLIAAENAQL